MLSQRVFRYAGTVLLGFRTHKPFVTSDGKNRSCRKGINKGMDVGNHVDRMGNDIHLVEDDTE